MPASLHEYTIICMYFNIHHYRSSMNRLIPAARVRAAVGGVTVVLEVGDSPSRYTTGVLPETPVPSLCPLNTVKSPSVINRPSPSDPKSSEVGRVRRRRTARSRTPRAARRATPPSEPTIAGTSGTTAEVDVDEGVAEVVAVVPGPPATVG